MKRETITANYLRTISWFNNSIVDWASAGMQYLLTNGQKQLARYTYSPFDSAIVSKEGQYTFLYRRVGTKGLLLKNGELLREINRPYYCAEVHEYPAAFITIEGITYLIHCPLKYCRLDFENVETGELITDVEGREPLDIFHSRLEVNEANTFLLSKGWVWHPRELVEAFNVLDCLKNPKLLDEWAIYPNVGRTEICTASFINNSKVIIGSSAEDDYDEDDEIPVLPPKHIATWDLLTNQVINPVKVNGEFGNLFAINERFAWDTFNFPKIINIKTGEIVDKDESVNSGKQNSSIIHSSEPPQIIFNRQTKQLAITGHERIEVLTPDDAFL